MSAKFLSLKYFLNRTIIKALTIYPSINKEIALFNQDNSPPNIPRTETNNNIRKRTSTSSFSVFFTTVEKAFIKKKAQKTIG